MNFLHRWGSEPTNSYNAHGHRLYLFVNEFWSRTLDSEPCSLVFWYRFRLAQYSFVNKKWSILFPASIFFKLNEHFLLSINDFSSKHRVLVAPSTIDEKKKKTPRKTSSRKFNNTELMHDLEKKVCVYATRHRLAADQNRRCQNPRSFSRFLRYSKIPPTAIYFFSHITRFP